MSVFSCNTVCFHFTVILIVPDYVYFFNTICLCCLFVDINEVPSESKMILGNLLFDDFTHSTIMGKSPAPFSLEGNNLKRYFDQR